MVVVVLVVAAHQQLADAVRRPDGRRDGEGGGRRFGGVALAQLPLAVQELLGDAGLADACV